MPPTDNRKQSQPPPTQSQSQRATGIELAGPALVWKELQRFKGAMEAALPKHITAERMAQIALTSIRENPELSKCTVDSFLGCVLKASRLGLEPGTLGQCYFIPFWNRDVGAKIATFVPGWKGLLDLVKRTERATATSRGIFDGDEYDYEFGDRPFIHHKPGKWYGDPSALRMTYAVGWTKGAEYPEIDVWTMERIWKHRDAQMKRTGAKSHYSDNYPEMYARKIPLLQVIKYLPTSIELSSAQTLDGEVEQGTQRLTFDVPIPGGGDPIEAEAKDVQVDTLMGDLDWDEQRRRDFKDGYRGRADAAIEYLEAEVKKRGKTPQANGQAQPQPQTAAQPKQQPAPAAQTQSQAQPDKPAQEATQAQPSKVAQEDFWA